MSDASSQQRLAAWHETGHALVSLWCQIPVHRVAIDAAGGGCTVVTWPVQLTVWDVQEAHQHSPSRCRTQLRALVAVCLAGAIAEGVPGHASDGSTLGHVAQIWGEVSRHRFLGSWDLLVFTAAHQVRAWFAAPGVGQLCALMVALLLRERDVSGVRWARVTTAHSARFGITMPPTVAPPPAPAARKKSAPPVPPPVRPRRGPCSVRDVWGIAEAERIDWRPRAPHGDLLHRPYGC